jgi:hypothetical protein
MKAIRLLTIVLALTLAFSVQGFGAAEIEIVNLNAGTGAGFDDPGAPVVAPGNPGTTIGEQRLEAFKEAAGIWGAALDSSVKIRILASFEPLACTADSAVLGSAGPTTGVANFPGAEFANTWYPIALANKLAGVRLIPTPSNNLVQNATTLGEIRARFNSELGNEGCFEGGGWYLGLDANEPTGQSDLVAVLLHEFGHGLGFLSFINKKTGTEFKGWPDVYSRLIQDNWTGINWGSTTPSIRRKTGVLGNIVFTGAEVTTTADQVLSKPPHLNVTAPAGIAGSYTVGTAGFGPAIKAAVSGELVYPNDGGGASLSDGCEAFAVDLTGKLALIDRGTCNFTVKVKNAQNAGAKGVVIADNDPANVPPPGLGGSDNSITIPSVRITKVDGDTIKTALGSTIQASLEENLAASTLAGADAQDHVRLYAPPVVAPGSSVSHYDTSAYRNLLMEPFINSDLTHSVQSPEDLTLELLHDIGW